MIVILDFGSQYTQLLARRIRELKVYCEILPYTTPLDQVRKQSPKGIILSGGPDSVAADHANGNGNGKDMPLPHPGVFMLGIPILGVCYGHQVLGKVMGGKVKRSSRREFGLSKLNLIRSADIFNGIKPKFDVWMSHGDEVAQMPVGFVALGSSENAPYAAMANPLKKVYGLQFHPEVSHTEFGSLMLKNFVFEICEEEPTWQMKDWIGNACKEITKQVGPYKVLVALSGGVDSSVVARLIHKAIGKQLVAVYVDTGLLKAGETERIRRIFGKLFEDSLIIIDAKERFLKVLKGVTDPEQKRKIIGLTFARIFEEAAIERRGLLFLAQGTLYPDVIESGKSVSGKAHLIKTHHNVGGLPDDLKLKLLEPVRNLFKDEVRELGRELGLSDEVLGRHPFPGPGFAVRILGEITTERVDVLRAVDSIVDEEIRRAGFYDRLWQVFPVLVGAKTVGVVGDMRNYQEVIAIRAVESLDGMTADWSKLPHELLGAISRRIVNEVPSISRVVYDITSKPPATIEWE
ncbi:MAG: glutamine-hydrolyzing GMP synthase [Elusimicrobia bacterium]|nr:glutamine-hydrolyzing GMP synthase [Elusimicrobiota bacterium]